MICRMGRDMAEPPKEKLFTGKGKGMTDTSIRETYFW